MLNIRFLIQRYLILFLNLLFQVILFRVFSIANAGVISYGRTLVQYFDFTNLGFRNTLDKRKYKNKKSLGILFSYVRTINLYISIVFAICLLVFAYDQKTLVLFILSGILYADLFYVKLYHRNAGNKKIYVQKSFIFELIPLATLLLSILLFDNTIIVGGLFFISNIIIYILFNKDLKRFPLLTWSNVCKKYLLKVIKLNFSHGVYIFLSSLLFFFLMSGDRILIKQIYGNYEIIAKISFLMLFMNGFTPLVNALIEINMKDILHDFPLKKIAKISLIILLGAIVYIIFIYLFQNLAVDRFFQKYLDIKDYIVYFTLLIIPCSIIQILQIILYRQNKQRLSFIAFIITGVVHAFLLSYTCLFSKEPIINILITKLLSLGLAAFFLTFIFVLSLNRRKKN